MIGVVCDSYYPILGGSQQLCKSVVEFFVKNGKDVTVVTSKNEDRKQYEFGYRICELDNLVLSNNKEFEDLSFESIIIFADLFSPSLLSYEPKTTENSILVLNLDENVYSWIENEQNGFTKENTRIIVSKIKKYTKVVSFCKNAPVNKFLEENKIEYEFIANFSRDAMGHTNKNFDIKKVLKLEEDKKIIFNHGLIENRKNQKYLIQKFIEADLQKDYYLIFLGNPRNKYDIRYYKECKDIVESNGLDNSVFFIKGTNKYEIISSILASSDIYILPSKAEGLPLVLLEAMSADLPWISTPVGGVPEVFKDLKGGKILSKIEFSAEELKKSLQDIEDCSNSRKEWKENFTEEIAEKRYMSLLVTEEEKKKYIKNKISFACHAYNEQETIGRYLKSCLQFSDILEEVVIVNHRSSDSTQKIIDSYTEEYKSAGVRLVTFLEKRDFSKNFTFADIRDLTLQKSSKDIVFMHDADFVFARGYRKIIYDSVSAFENDFVYSTQYGIPVLDGKVCKMHVPVPRVLRRKNTQYRQDHVGHKYEWARPISPECDKVVSVYTPKNSILSINTKTENAKELRRTMTTYFEDVFAGKVDGSWHEAYAKEALRKEKAFFDSIHDSSSSEVQYDIEEFIF